MNNQLSLFTGVDLIYSYTRAKAVEDGVLIDVTDTAREAGILFPVALTRALWNAYIVPDESLKCQAQSIEGRLWDTLWLFRTTARRCKKDIMYFTVYYLVPVSSSKRVKLKSICSPGDNGEPVITIMLPNED